MVLFSFSVSKAIYHISYRVQSDVGRRKKSVKTRLINEDIFSPKTKKFLEKLVVCDNISYGRYIGWY